MSFSAVSRCGKTLIKSRMVPRISGRLYTTTLTSPFRHVVQNWNSRRTNSYFADQPFLSPNLSSQSNILLNVSQEETQSKKTWMSSIFHALLVLVRFFQLTIYFAPPLFLAPFSLFSSTIRNSLFFPSLVTSMKMAGPSFMKLGQWISARPDIFPPTLCDRFKHFQSQLPPHSFRYTKRVVEEAFGEPLSQIFELFEEKPLASGSIAQVHRARMLKDGREVAVKVRHPHIERMIDADLTILHIFGQIVHALPGMKWLAVPDSIRQFSEVIHQQLDLTTEAKNLKTFIKHFKGDERVTFPDPLEPYVHEKVLVETFEDGIHISKLLSSKIDSAEKAELASIGMSTFCKMLFDENFVHGDLHPGNILVTHRHNGNNNTTENGKIRKSVQTILKNMKNGQTTDVKMVILDAGVVCTLSPEDRKNFLGLFGAVATGDGQKGAELMISESKEVSPNCDKEKFTKEMAELFEEAKSVSLDKIDAKQTLGGVLRLVQKHGVRIDTNFANLIVAIVVLEGLAKQLDPHLNVVSQAFPYWWQATKGVDKENQSNDSRLEEFLSWCNV